MREFKLDEHVSVICEWKKTRTAFKHEAVLLIDGNEQDRTKICYQNRTWESYEYQSVLLKLINDTKVLTAEQKALFIAYARKDHADMSMFKTIANIALMSEVLCDTQKEKNDWKKRMINAGLPDIVMPDDWESLSEDEKENRLNNTIKVLKEVQ